MRVLSIVGTRPEAIKMAPVIASLASDQRFQSRLCVTGQHREMVDSVLSLFEIIPDFDLNIMKVGQNLEEITGSVLTSLKQVFRSWFPDILLVQGDTTSAMAAALAGFYEKIPVGHVEAGLRTGDIYSPWPEEVNRKIVGCVASIHFAPTEQARRNLLSENVDAAKIVLTGNTVIDSLLATIDRIRGDEDFVREMHERYPFLADASGRIGGRNMLLVTAHRRESFGAGFEKICLALRELARRSDVQIVYPVHLNPNVREPVRRLLGEVENIALLEPLDYRRFVYFMYCSRVILTDSGGVQEEAPALGKPVVLMRDATERGEGLAAGSVKLVGANADEIVSATTRLLEDSEAYERMSQKISPYGDGKASDRIVRALLSWKSERTG